MDPIEKEILENISKKYRKITDDKLQQHIDDEFTECIGEIKQPIVVESESKSRYKIKYTIKHEPEKKPCRWCKKLSVTLTATKFLGSLCDDCLKHYNNKEI